MEIYFDGVQALQQFPERNIKKYSRLKTHVSIKLRAIFPVFPDIPVADCMLI